MSFPQTSAADYVTGNENLWRLKTQLASPGDIYESEVSGLAFMIGPESDIANVQVTYFNGQAPPTQTSTLLVSPDKAFVGLISARNETTYPLTKSPDAPARKGRILVAPADLYDPAYVPIGASTDDTIEFEVPILDVIQYFTPPPSIISPRVDKTFSYNFYNAISPDVNYLVIPYYGRKYAYITITNWTAAEPISFGVRGVNYSFTNNPSQQHQETVILAPFVVAPAGTRKTQLVRASVNGMFDALVISVVGSVGPCPLKVIMSDDAI